MFSDINLKNHYSHFHSCPRFVHGLTCAGVLPTPYINFSRFSGFGCVGHGYISQGELS